MAWIHWSDRKRILCDGKRMGRDTEARDQRLKTSSEVKSRPVSCTDTWFQAGLIGCFLVFLQFTFAHPSLHRNDFSSPSISTFTHLLNSLTLIDTAMSPHKTNLLKKVPTLLEISFFPLSWIRSPCPHASSALFCYSFDIQWGSFVSMCIQCRVFSSYLSF